MTYTPDGKCKTCRHMHYLREGDGVHEPLTYIPECMVESELIEIASLMKGIAGNIADEEAYGEYPEEGWGESKPCPLYLEWETCKTHGLRAPPQADFGCQKCDEEGYEAWATADDEGQLAPGSRAQ